MSKKYLCLFSSLCLSVSAFSTDTDLPTETQLTESVAGLPSDTITPVETLINSLLVSIEGQETLIFDNGMQGFVSLTEDNLPVLSAGVAKTNVLFVVSEHPSNEEVAEFVRLLSQIDHLNFVVLQPGFMAGLVGSEGVNAMVFIMTKEVGSETYSPQIMHKFASVKDALSLLRARGINSLTFGEATLIECGECSK